MSQDEFRTSDLYYAAFLQASGLEMIRTERRGPKVYFIFDGKDDDMEDLRERWFNRQAMVPANPYAMAIKNLKSLCHAGQDG